MENPKGVDVDVAVLAVVFKGSASVCLPGSVDLMSLCSAVGESKRTLGQSSTDYTRFPLCDGAAVC